LDDTIDRRLGTFRKDSVRRPPAEVADMMVDLIRAAARHGKYGKYIGRNCMSIIVPREGSFTGSYHPDKARKTQHYPHLVVPGIAIRDLQQTSDGGDFLGISYGGIDPKDQS
jgi:hypothetical protein